MKFFLIIASFIISFNSYSLSFTTYNAGLAHTFVPLAEHRRDPIISELKKSDTDVLCLQEVWNEEDRDLIAASLKEKYPYSFYKKITQNYSKNAPTCGLSDLFGEGKFISCLRSDCDGKEGDAFTKCLITRCGGTLEQLKKDNRDCAQGLLAQVGKSTLRALLTVFNPFSSAGVFAFEGSDGIMLLSKKPLKNKNYFEFKPLSTTNRRAVLMAIIEDKDQKIQLGCTHLTANLGGVAPYTGPYKTWAEENYSQVKLLISKMTEPKQVIMGDFNCALDFPKMKLAGDFQKNCKIFKETGYTDLFEETKPLCTFCKDNTLLKKHAKSKLKEINGILIDHIYTKGLKPTTVKRVYDRKTIIKVDGKKQESHLSDHYGIELSL